MYILSLDITMWTCPSQQDILRKVDCLLSHSLGKTLLQNIFHVIVSPFTWTESISNLTKQDQLVVLKQTCNYF